MKKILAFSLLTVSFNSYCVTFKDVSDPFDVTKKLSKYYENKSENFSNYDEDYIQLKENEKSEIYDTIKYYADAKSLANLLYKYRGLYNNDQRKVDLTFSINSTDAYWRSKDILHYITELKSSAAPLLEVLIGNNDKFYIDFTKEDSHGNSPLYNACKSNDIASVKQLLSLAEVKEKINSSSSKYKSPLYVASVYRFTEIIELLKKNGAINSNESSNYYDYANTTEKNYYVNSNGYDTKSVNEEKDFKEIYTIDTTGQLHFTQKAQTQLYNAVVKQDSANLDKYLSYYNNLMKYTYNIFKVVQYFPAKLTYNYNNETTLFHIAINAKDHNILRVLLKYRGIFNFDFYIKDKNGSSVYDKVSSSGDNYIKSQFNSNYTSYYNIADPYAAYSGYKDYNSSAATYSDNKTDSNTNKSATTGNSYNSNSSNINNDTSRSTNNSANYSGYYTTNTGYNTNTNASINENSYSGKKLENSNFYYRTLKNVKFVDSKLAGSKFTYANLSGADFTNADLSDVDFTGADLAYANLSGANLSGAKFTNAKIYRTDLTRITLSNKTIFPQSYDIILREEDVVYNDNKVHKFVAASNFFQTSCGAGGCSASQAASAFEKNLIDSSKEQKKRHDKESKQVKYDDPESTYKTPNIEDLRRKREELLQKIKSKN